MKKIDSVLVICDFDLPEDTIKKEVSVAKERAALLKKQLHSVAFFKTKDGYEVEYREPTPRFERIRRITGYLVGTLDRWNDAKAAEERDRVKHNVNQRGESDIKCSNCSCSNCSHECV